MKRLQRLAVLVWASPYSAIGCSIGLVGLATGGGAQRRDGILEFYGGFTRWVVRHSPLGECCAAITLGHTVIGQTVEMLDFAHDHELVHVRQFERWGPMMGPAYLGCSIALWLTGKRAYLDNPFEKEAYSNEPLV